MISLCCLYLFLNETWLMVADTEQSIGLSSGTGPHLAVIIIIIIIIIRALV